MAESTLILVIGHLPARQRVLIPEIIGLILGTQTDTPAELLNAALVCRDWGEIALDWLWRKAKLSKLIRILVSPTSVDRESGTIEWVRKDTFAHWRWSHFVIRNLKMVRKTSNGIGISTTRERFAFSTTTTTSPLKTSSPSSRHVALWPAL